MLSSTADFHRTLQEHVFDIHCFQSIDDARMAIAKFINDYSRAWLIERLGHYTRWSSELTINRRS